MDVLLESEFPYMSGRLKELNYKKIIKEGNPWKDPCFPHGKFALFINHINPQKEHAESKAKWVRDFHWKRAS